MRDVLDAKFGHTPVMLTKSPLVSKLRSVSPLTKKFLLRDMLLGNRPRQKKVHIKSAEL